jgi:hypothetical protein
MSVPIKIVTRHDAHPDLSRREHSGVLRAAMLDMGLKWAVDLLPEHFRKDTQGQFRYAARTEKWKKRKRRLFSLGLAIAPDTDLVCTGRLREQVLYSARNLVRAFPSRVRIGMFGPKYFTLRGKSAHTIRLAEEVLRVSTGHKRRLADAADGGFNAELRRVRAGRRLRKTVSTS